MIRHLSDTVLTLLQSLDAVVLNSVQSPLGVSHHFCVLTMELPMANFELCHQLHGLLPITQPGMISVYRALKQRPKTDLVAGY